VLGIAFGQSSIETGPEQPQENGSYNSKKTKKNSIKVQLQMKTDPEFYQS
jgi:hypothetical protein